MDRYRAQIAAALDAVEIHSSFRFSWFGRPVPQRWTYLRKNLTPSTAEALFREQLRDHLYERFYCVGSAVPDVQPTASWARRADVIEFLNDLSAANRGSESWQSGWRMAENGDPAKVQRGGLTLLATPQEYRAAGDGTDGATVDLLMPKEHFEASPGYYVALGSEPIPAAAPVIRLYWNSTPGGALLLTRVVTERLNRLPIPFLLKALSDPCAYSRCDSVVLYVRGSDFASLAEWIPAIHGEVSHQLKEGIPALTKPLAPGLGLAEGPPDGGSFGLSRCTLIADSLARAHEKGLRGVSERLGFLEETFAARGVSLDVPFLNAGSHDAYGLPGVRRPTRGRPGEAEAQLDPAAPLGAAAALARRLCAEAIWSGDRCNWVGALPDGEGVESWETGRTAALGPEIYSGSSGIALFLALAAARLDDSDLRKTALGAIRQAVSRVEGMSPRTTPPGFYAGWAGVALAAARIGVLLNDEDSLVSSRALIGKFMRRSRESEAFDLIYGRAGAIPPLLSLAAIMGDPACVRLARRMGDGLLRTARRDDNGSSWPFRGTMAGSSSGARGADSLIGMAHGAAGAAYALLELYHATGDTRYRDSALDAVRFERRWFDPARGDWRDTRGRRGKALNSQPVFTATWCHGAPGIALTRIRAYEITGDGALRAEAIAGLEATRRAVGRDLSRGPANVSLCHGIVGNADVLLSGRSIVDREDSGAYSKLASQAASHVARDLAEDARASDARVGAPGWARKPLGLMLGIAGAGYLCLRAGDPKTPSVLLAGGPESVSAGGAESSRPATHLSA